MPLVVDDAGQVFEQRPDGTLAFIGERPKRSIPERVFRTVEYGLKRGFYGLPEFMADVPWYIARASEKVLPKTGITIPFEQPSTVMEKFVRTPQLESFPERLVGETIGGGLGGGLAGAMLKGSKLLEPGLRTLKPSFAGTQAQQAYATRADALEMAKKALAQPEIAAGAISGAGAGAGGETAAQVLGESPWARLAGSLIGGGGAPVVTSAGKLAGSLSGMGKSVVLPGRVREALKDVPEEQFETAKQNLDLMAEQGIPGTTAQAFPGQTPLISLQEKLTGVPGAGPIISRKLTDQMLDAEEAARKGLETVAPPSPATVASQQAKRAAKEAIEGARQKRLELTEPELAFTTTNVPRESVINLIRQMRQLVHAPKTGLGPTTPAGNFIETHIIGKIATKTKAGLKYETRTGALNDIFLAAKTRLGNPQSWAEDGIDRGTAARIKTALEPFKEYLDSFRAAPKLGWKTWHEVTKKEIQPMHRGLVRQIAGPGEPETTAAYTARLTSILLDPTVVRAQTIKQGAAALAKHDKAAFPRLARATLERKLEEAFGSKEGYLDPQAPGKYAEAVWGSPSQIAKRENFRAMIAASAKSWGKTDLEAGQAVRGAEKLMRALEMAGRGRGGMGRLVEEPTLVGEELRAAGALSIYLPQAPGVIARVGERLTKRKSNVELAELLAAGTPESVDILRQMARRDPAEIRAALVAGALPSITIQISEQR